MKKNYIFKFLLFSIPFAAFLLMSLSGGRDGAFSGSPGDGGANCTTCHSGTVNASNVSVTTDIPITGYEFNTEYNITITNSAGTARNGFQVTAEKTDNSKVGAFAAGTGGFTQAVNGNTRATHTSSGNGQNTWTVKWTSPASEQGRITFYAASVASNNDGSTAGDQVFTGNSGSVPSLSISEAKLLKFEMFPNPSSDMVKVQLPSGTVNASVSMYDYVGRLVYSKKITTVDNTINVQELSKGMYILRVTTEDKVGAQQFIKS